MLNCALFKAYWGRTYSVVLSGQQDLRELYFFRNWLWDSSKNRIKAWFWILNCTLFFGFAHVFWNPSNWLCLMGLWCFIFVSAFYSSYVCCCLSLDQRHRKKRKMVTVCNLCCFLTHFSIFLHVSTLLSAAFPHYNSASHCREFFTTPGIQTFHTFIKLVIKIQDKYHLDYKHFCCFY